MINEHLTTAKAGVWSVAAALAAHISVAPETPGPEQVVRAMFDAFNRHDGRAMKNLYAEDAVLKSSDFCTPRGRADVERTYNELFFAHPDVFDEIGTLIVGGDQVAVQFTARSKTGAVKLEIPMIAIMRVRDGRIVEDTTVFDTGSTPCRH